MQNPLLNPADSAGTAGHGAAAAGPEQVGNVQDAWQGMWDKLDGWLDAAINMLPNALLALVVLMLAVFASRFLNRSIERLSGRFSSNQAVNKLMANIGSVILVILGLILALGIMDLNKALSSMLAGAGIAGLVIGLAFQDSMANLLAGVLMSLRNPYNIGDMIETNGITGIIQKITLRTLHVKTFQGQLVVIPNRMVVENPLTNYTVTGERRVDISCGVSYGDDLARAAEIAKQAIVKSAACNNEREVTVFYEGFGSSSVDFTVRFWLGHDCLEPSDYLQARHEAVVAIHRSFQENGITIPFPIRTLDFGIKGGEKIDESLHGLFAEGGPSSRS